MKLSENLWQDIQPIYADILALPFIKQLINGTLEPKAFEYYMQQDTLYLNDYTRSLALVASKAPSSDIMLIFLKFAQIVLESELQLHQQYVATKNLIKGKACTGYTKFLLQTCSTENFAVALAAILPCFWIYQQVGIYAKQHSAKNNPYQDWIDLYSGSEFAEETQQVIDILDAQKVSDADIGAIKNTFTQSTIHELAFWTEPMDIELMHLGYR